MQQEGIAFEEHDIERDSSARERARRLNPRGSVPTIDVDGQLMVGFSAQRLEYLVSMAAQRRFERE
jgi:glutaredoxin